MQHRPSLHVIQNALVFFFVFLTVAAVAAVFFFEFQAPTPTQAGFETSAVSEVVTNDYVYAVAVASDGTQYIGGNFTYVGPNTGYGIEVNKTTGAQVGSGASVNGPVHAITSDGAGGWYIGGTFTQVGGETRNGLARILSNGTVDSAWDPGVSGGNATVSALLYTSNTVYVGGNFTTVGGQLRNSLAALDPTTGNATDFNPDIQNFGSQGSVYALTVSSGVLYVGGNFDTAAATGRDSFAAFDMTTEQLEGFYVDVTLSGFATDVRSLAIDENMLYIGGNFDSVSGTARNSVAAVNLTTQEITAFDPDITDSGLAGTVRSMALTTDTLFIGGGFDTVGLDSREALAGIDLGTGNATAFNGSLSNEFDAFSSIIVYDIAVYDDTLYVGGDFRNASTNARNHAAAFNIFSGSVTSWDPSSGDVVYAVEVTADDAFVGGDMGSIGGETRYSLASIDSNNELTSWAPELSHQTSGPTVNALQIEGDTLYVGGYFDDVDGSTRNSLAVFSTLTGALSTVDPNVQSSGAVGTVNALLVDGNDLYIGGSFTHVDGTARTSTAVFDVSLEQVTALDLSIEGQFGSGTIDDFALSNNILFVAGSFIAVSSTDLGGVAAVNTETGELYAFSVDPQNFGFPSSVSSIAVVTNTLFVGGQFDEIAGESRTSFAAFDISDLSTATLKSANYDAENFGFAANIYDTAVVSGTVFVGGQFDSLSSSTRYSVGSVDARLAALNSWAPEITLNGAVGQIYDIEYAAGNLYIGGSFNSVEGAYHENYVVLPMPFVSFEQTTSSVLESAGTTDFVVELDQVHDQDVTVAYAVVGGTATGDGTDYTLASGTSTISAGETTTSIQVVLVDDGVGDNEETVVVHLSSPGESSIGNNIEYTLTLTEDTTPSIQFETTTSSASEASTTISIVVEASAAVTATTTVNYEASAGTATGSGTDYTLAAGTSTIAIGDTTTSISLTIVNDDIAEDDETVIITLSNPVNANLGTNATTTHTIEDNDTAGFTVSAISGNVTEAGGTSTFTVVLTSQPTDTVTTTVSSSDTTEGTVAVTELVFTTSTWDDAQTVTVTGVDDSDVDGNTAFTIQLGSAVSNDANYNGLNPDDVSVTNTDNDSADSAGNDSGGSSSEGGGGAHLLIRPRPVTPAPLPSQDAADPGVDPSVPDSDSGENTDEDTDGDREPSQTTDSGDICALSAGQPYRSQDSQAVYIITDLCTKWLLPSPTYYFSYFTSWDSVRVVPRETLDRLRAETLPMPLGPLHNLQTGDLAKILSRPHVYYISGEFKQWIVSEGVFHALGFNLRSVRDVSETLLNRYKDAAPITSPEGILQ